MLVDLLQCQPLAGVSVPDEVHRAVRPVGHQLDHLEVLLAGRLGLGPVPEPELELLLRVVALPVHAEAVSAGGGAVQGRGQLLLQRLRCPGEAQLGDDVLGQPGARA